jgi:hypothetical protein
VAVTFENIRNEFSELRNLILNDLKIIRGAPKGGNYAAALLVVTACEAAGTLRYGRKDGGFDFFRDYLVPEKWRSVSNSIYNALRNGLAHSFLTKAILKTDDKPIELGISWSKENHFEYDSRRATLFINIQEISKNLREAFEQYEWELEQNAELRDKFITWRKKQRVFEVEDQSEKEAWKMLVK